MNSILTAIGEDLTRQCKKIGVERYNFEPDCILRERAMGVLVLYNPRLVGGPSVEGCFAWSVECITHRVRGLLADGINAAGARARQEHDRAEIAFKRNYIQSLETILPHTDAEKVGASLDILTCSLFVCVFGELKEANEDSV